MEILVGPGAMDYDLALWSAVPWATPSVGTVSPELTVNWSAVQFSPGCSWASTSWNVWSGTEQAAVSALTAVGAALEAALQALLAYILALVSTTITSALSYIGNSFKALASDYLVPIASAMCGCSGGGQLGSTPTATVVEAALGSPVMTFITTFAVIVTVVEIVMGVLSVVTLGTSEILSFIIPIILIAVITIAVRQASVSGYIPASFLATVASGAALFTAAGQVAGTLVQAVTSLSVGLPTPKIGFVTAAFSPASSPTFQTILDYVLNLASFFGAGLAGVILFGSLAATTSSALIIGMALAVMGIMFDLAGLLMNVQFSSGVLATMALFGIVLDVTGFYDVMKYLTNPANRYLEITTNADLFIGLDLLVLGSGALAGGAEIGTLI